MGAVTVTPRSLKDPQGVAGSQAPRVWTRYELFLGDIRAGTRLEEAMERHLITRKDIETACLTADGLQAFIDATKAAQRRAWSVLDIQEVFDRISQGAKVKDAIDAVKPGNATLLSIVTEDKALWAEYQRALKSRAILMADDLEDWAEDDKDDILENGKGGQLGNNAAVARDKLKVDTRFRLMASWYPSLFNDRQAPNTQVNVQINHAARLEEARARAQTRRVVLPAEPDRVPIEMLQEVSATVSDATLQAGRSVENGGGASDSNADWRDTSWLQK